MPGLTEKEKEKLGNLVIFDLAKNFISNITTFMEELEPKWDYIARSMTLKNNKLSVSFLLK